MAGVEKEVAPAAAADDRPSVWGQWTQARPMLDRATARMIRIQISQSLYQNLPTGRIEAGVESVELHRARDAQAIAQRHHRDLASVIRDGDPRRFIPAGGLYRDRITLRW